MRRITGFDGIKGIAMVAIICYHLFPQQVPGGFLLVNTFFVLGGYFFARKMEAILQQYHDREVAKQIWQYVKQMVSRLFIPVFWTIMLIVTFLLLFNRIDLLSLRNDLLSGLTFTNNIFQIFAERSYFVQMAGASPTTHFWYNALYLQAFLISIPIIWGLHRLRLPIIHKAIIWLLIVYLSHFSLVLFYKPGEDPSRVYYGLETRYSSFAMGIATAYIVPTILNMFYRLKHKQFLYNLIALISFGMMVQLTFTATDQAPMTYAVWLPVFSVLSMLHIFTIVVGSPVLNFILDFPLFTWIGKRSYSFYLWYYPIIVLCMSQLRLVNQNVHILNVAALILIPLVSQIAFVCFEQGKWYVPFGSDFNLKRAMIFFQETERPLSERRNAIFRLGGFVVLLGLFLTGLAYSRNDKPLAQFELEYRFWKGSPNAFNVLLPSEQYIVSVSDKVKYADKVLNTQLIASRVVVNDIKDIMVSIRNTSDNLDELQVLIEQNQQLFDNLSEINPELAKIVTVPEIVFASEVPVTLFGDSIAKMNGVIFEDLFLNSETYGYVSLRIWEGIDIFRDLINQGVVADNVVVVLGTNAGLEQDIMDQFVEVAGNRKLFFVNTNSAVPHADQVNTVIRDTAAKYPNVYEVDWKSEQKGHPEWYGEDDIHHSLTGIDYFTALVARKMHQVIEVSE